MLRLVLAAFARVNVALGGTKSRVVDKDFIAIHLAVAGVGHAVEKKHARVEEIAVAQHGRDIATNCIEPSRGARDCFESNACGIAPARDAREHRRDGDDHHRAHRDCDHQLDDGERARVTTVLFVRSHGRL